MKIKRLTRLLSIVCALTALALCLTGCPLLNGGGDIAGELRDKFSNTSSSSKDEQSDPDNGSGGSKELSGDIAWRDGDIAAAAYLAYGIGDELAVNKKLYSARYSFVNGAIDEVGSEGYEYYYIVPRYPDCRIVVESLDSDGQTPVSTLYESKNEAVTVLLLANYSDIIPNTRVTVTYNGESVSFSPSLSLKGDGEIMNPLPNGIREISVQPLRTYSPSGPDLNSWPKELENDRPVISAVLDTFGPLLNDYRSPSELDKIACVNYFAQAYLSRRSDYSELCSNNGHYLVMSEDVLNRFVRSMWAGVSKDVVPEENGDTIKYDAEKREYYFAEYGAVLLKYFECYDFYDRGDGTATMLVKCWVAETSYSDTSTPNSLFTVELVRNDEPNALTNWRISDYDYLQLTSAGTVGADELVGEWEFLETLDSNDGYAVYHLTLNENGEADFYYGWLNSDIASLYSGRYTFDEQSATLRLELQLQNTVVEGDPESLTPTFSVELEDSQLVLGTIDGSLISGNPYAVYTFSRV